MKDEDKNIFMHLPSAYALSVVIAGEARGEADDPKIPYDEARDVIGSVVLNRADYGRQHHGWGKLYGDSVQSCIAGHDQFSCLNSNDKNYGLLMELVHDFEGSLKKYSWLPKIYDDARGLLDGSIPRIVKGLFYETLTCKVLWNLFSHRDGHDPEVEAIIGSHRIYKTI